MKNIKLSELFLIKSGKKVDFVNVITCRKEEKDSVNYVSRTSFNNGSEGYVKTIIGLIPNGSHTISVAGLLDSFYQSEPYYSGVGLFVLTPKKQMTKIEMIYYSLCIRKNKYRYNYGRSTSVRDLKNLLVPEEIPKEFMINEDDIFNILNFKQKISDLWKNV